ncbi:SufE family protein [Vibrio sp. TRT 17S01]|uniref:SufE family protein n=1 Tax=Vibrio sp. TRT 17S01 TaxID=3418505 RepID=UPI003CF673EB
MTPDKLVKNFQRCKNWEERYLYLIELGERYCQLPEVLCINDNKVKGCQSEVWVSIQVNKNTISLAANSDAAIVRGLLALVVIAYNDQTIEEARQFDINVWFEQLALMQHLTPTRALGLTAIIRQIQHQIV